MPVGPEGMNQSTMEVLGTPLKMNGKNYIKITQWEIRKIIDSNTSMTLGSKAVNLLGW